MADRALVIVPTYNERAAIEEVIRRLFATTGDRVDLLVVDDSSPDGTGGAVSEIATGRGSVHLIAREAKQGLASAYVTGFTWALERGYGAIVEMDGDLSHDPADVTRLLDALEDADLVIGSRYVAGGSVRNWGVPRKTLSRAANLYTRLCLGYPVADWTAGFRAYRATALNHLGFEAVSSEGYGFQIELTRAAARMGCRIVEIPITFAERGSGRSKMTLGIAVEALVNVARWGWRDRVVTPLRRSAGRGADRP